MEFVAKGFVLFCYFVFCYYFFFQLVSQIIYSIPFTHKRRLIKELEILIWVVVINALSQGPGCLSSYGNVIDDILVLADDFQLCLFNHVKRLCNVVADMLAKKAKDLLGVRVWLDDLPEDIQPLVLFDAHWVCFLF